MELHVCDCLPMWNNKHWSSSHAALHENGSFLKYSNDWGLSWETQPTIIVPASLSLIHALGYIYIRGGEGAVPSDQLI